MALTQQRRRVAASRPRPFAPLLLALALLAASAPGPAAAHVRTLERITPLPLPAAAAKSGHTPRLEPDVAQIPLSKIAGEYNFVGANKVAKTGAAGCPAKIVLDAPGAPQPGMALAYGPTSGVLPHEKVSVDGVGCRAGGFVEFADINSLLRKNGASSSGTASKDAVAVAVARDSTTRVCGNYNFSGAFQFIDDVPKYRPTLESIGATPTIKGGFDGFRKGSVLFPVVKAGPPSPDDPLAVQPVYCWYENAQTKSSESKSSSCFPSGATVQLESGVRTTMRDLSIGERVLVAPGRYSEVFMFTHRHQYAENPDDDGPTPNSSSTAWNSFIQLHTASGHSLTLTAGHVLPLADGRLVPAGDVSLGDNLLVLDSASPHDHVTSISPVVWIERTCQPGGLYNPQTIHGDIVVDGVVSTTYTTGIRAPLAHALLAPLRALFRWTGASISLLDRGMDIFPEALHSFLTSTLSETIRNRE